MSYLTLQMKQLPNDVNQGFHNGLFVSKLREGNFNSVWIDYVLEGITVRLGTVSVGAIGFMRIRNKYGRTLVNPNFCSADTWS